MSRSVVSWVKDMLSVYRPSLKNSGMNQFCSALGVALSGRY